MLTGLGREPLLCSTAFIGVVSPNPATCSIVASVFWPTEQWTQLFLSPVLQAARPTGILDGTTVEYLKNVKLYGSLYDLSCTSGARSNVSTNLC
ncbi:hypothetical protein OBBRIDRAFT_342327 [Obba rivulosa]|uniref:Uncharacterized protein n=1 Tax=Obba rivulosa TaxID=1052685 RepID=A0A8E2AKK9_9APHY|nr:hypothetical protein OBBRIDRAFT_342327 [Obba rivulosa]